MSVSALAYCIILIDLIVAFEIVYYFTNQVWVNLVHIQSTWAYVSLFNCKNKLPHLGYIAVGQ